MNNIINYEKQELKCWDFSRDNVEFTAVTIPHDWAITGAFDRNNDNQIIRNIHDGETKESEHNGRTGALPHAGKGFYNCEVEIDLTTDQLYQLYFEGAMSHAQVYVNKQVCGFCNYGYTSFYVDITSAVVNGKNLIEIELDNPPESSRWYPGAGLYRRVFLQKSGLVRFAPWGIYAQYYGGDNVEVEFSIENHSNKPTSVNLSFNIDEIASYNEELFLNGSSQKIVRKIPIANYELWSVDNPKCYKLTAALNNNDYLELSYGLRTINYSYEDGFRVNGECVEFKGVCMHHDLGPIGSAFNLVAAQRQLSILKEMGCNAIRTAHNPPTPQLLELCDEMGFLVMDEAFDTWRVPKLENDYHKHFESDAKKDLSSLILRDRNHPCVVIWSIGNEILDQLDENGGKTAAMLTAIVKDYDNNRPVTCGFNFPEAALANKLAENVDIPGWNYRPFDYHKFHKMLPKRLMLGSETLSVLSSRGYYKFPAKPYVYQLEGETSYEICQASSYAIETPPWATTLEKEWQAQDSLDYIIGQFIWTGFDYLGEPTPFNQEWPARSSYFGCVDLVGLPKDLYYVVQSLWRSDIPILHIIPHWSWQAGMNIPVHIVGNCHAVELFLNGRSLGVRKKDLRSSDLLQNYRFIWDEISFEAGELLAVGYDENECEVNRAVHYTVGELQEIKLQADKSQVIADGEDMIFVEVSIVDANNVESPIANNLVEVDLCGDNIELVAFDGGDPTSLEKFNSSKCKLFNGKAVIYLKSTGKQGVTQLTVRSDSYIKCGTLSI